MSNFQSAFSAILKYGTPKQREIIRNIQHSSMKLSIEALTNASADTGLIDSTITQQKIDTQYLNEVQAFGEIECVLTRQPLRPMPVWKEH